MHRYHLRLVFPSQKLVTLFHAFQYPVITYILNCIMTDAGPDSFLEQGLRSGKRSAEPAKLVADDDILRRNFKITQYGPELFKSKSGAVLPCTVENNRFRDMPQAFTYNGFFCLIA